MLSEATLECILARLPSLHIGVLGDLFLDRYLDIDPALTEPSVETGLDAYQVVRVRSYPGAAGTVINNLAALGVGTIHALAVVGDDGEGFELRQALASLPAVQSAAIFSDPERRTPTYTKPMVCTANTRPRELNRLDIKNRTVLSMTSETKILEALERVWPRLDALLVLDQVKQPDTGVVTARVRERLQLLGEHNPEKMILADSRERIGLFRGVCLKPNQTECLGATGLTRVDDACLALAQRCGRTVFCTQGDQGILIAEAGDVKSVAGFKVTGPIDTVGAGDSTSAGIACAVAAGASREEAAAFGNLVASITIQQIGTTGTANPQQVRRRWQDSCGA